MNVLIICHKFPPDQGVATFRVAKFAKYLSEFGCEIHVISMDNGNIKESNVSEDIKNIQNITRIEPLSDWVPVVNLRVNRWIPPMIKRAIREIKKHDIDIVLHSVPARMPSIGCLPIKKITNVPYLIDLRDPFYTGNVGPTGQHIGEDPNDSTYQKVLKFIEPKVLNCSSNIILNNKQMLNIYCNEYPQLQKKMNIIYNGFDPTDFIDITPRNSDKFRIVFPGKFRDDMRWFFEPFAEFINEKDDVVFTHFGRKDRDMFKQVESVVADLGLEKYVDFEGYTNKQKVLSTVMGAELGLITSKPGSKIYAGMKTFDYMGCNLPILGVDDGESAMRSILSGFSNAYIVERSDLDTIYETLNLIYKDRPNDLGSTDIARSYTLRNQTHKLYKLMKKSNN